MKGLTPKQQRFVDAYLTSLNATDAARKAGYKGNDVTLGAVGKENLQKPLIKQYLTKRHTQVAQKAEKQAVDVYHEFQKNLEFVAKIRDAAEKWLIDPEDSEKFTVDPRADEIDVVYKDGVVERRATLAELLSKIEGQFRWPTPFVKTIDLREYALKAIDKCDMAIDKFAKMGGFYTKERENPEDINARVRQRLIDAGYDPDRVDKIVAEKYDQNSEAIN